MTDVVRCLGLPNLLWVGKITTIVLEATNVVTHGQTTHEEEKKGYKKKTR